MEIPSYEQLMERMLSLIPDSVDKREGSLIYTAAAPVCAELLRMYIALQGYYDLSFGDTAQGEYLDRITNQYGITRKQAAKAVFSVNAIDRQGETLVLPQQSRFTVNGHFGAINDEGYFVCDEEGRWGNLLFGEMIPVNYLNNFGSAELWLLVSSGEDRESDEDLRRRFADHMASPAFGGNVSDYRQKAKSLAGVGAVKVFPACNGSGTVKLTILGEELLPVTAEFALFVKQQFDPDPGKGLGLAPIGHCLTVVSAQPVPVGISADITVEEGADETVVHEAIVQKLQQYFCAVRAEWEQTEGQVLRVSRAESAILSAEGVLDVENCLFAGVSGNLSLTSEQVPILEGLNGVL